MCFNAREFFFTFDIIGPTPNLLIYNEKRYKSFFSSIISIIIIILMILFSMYLLVQFFKFDTPIIVYSKASDNLVNRSINIKDTFLIFQLTNSKERTHINNSLAYYEAEYSAIYDNGKILNFPLIIEPCILGKNLNMKFSDEVEEKYKFGRNIEDFYCLNSDTNDINLFYLPNVGYSNINLYIKIREGINLPPENIQTLIVSENNLIDHNNKANPIGESFIYSFTSSYSSSDFSIINYNFQYIKYDTDEGLFFKSNNILTGISFSDMTYSTIKKENNYNTNDIGVLTLGINKSNYDYYQRSYKKVQALLAEIMSIVNLIIEIGRIIGIIFLNKKMSCDIINKLLKKGENNIENKNISNKIHNTNKTLSKRTANINSRIYYNNIDISKSSNSGLNLGNTNKDKDYDKTFKKINYFQILKSYLCCCEDKKTKLINYCHKIIKEDICVDKILERFYISETINEYLMNKKHKKIEYIDNNKFKLVEQYLFDINGEIGKSVNDINNNKLDLK